MRRFRFRALVAFGAVSLATLLGGCVAYPYGYYGEPYGYGYTYAPPPAVAFSFGGGWGGWHDHNWHDHDWHDRRWGWWR